MTRWLNSTTRAFLADTRERRRASEGRYRYYHEDDAVLLNRLIQPSARVLLIGLDVERLAARIRAAQIEAIDIQGERFTGAPAHVKSLAGLDEATPAPDYILLPYTLQFLEDIQGFLTDLQKVVSPQTRIVSVQYNFIWSPVLTFAQKCGLRAPLPNLNWLGLQDVRNLLTLTGYQEIASDTRLLLPVGIPGLAPLINGYVAPLPIIRHFNFKTFMVARPAPAVDAKGKDYRVSVVVPARNEAGNIAPLLDRLPALGRETEVIFVEGHSKDETWDVIQAQASTHPRRNAFTVKALRQTGKGKADAVRLGFSKATGDILLILDADLSVQPEDLKNFYDAMKSGGADFLNGSRLVYEMEQKAMQFLNLIFNKAFALLMSWLIGQQVKDTLCGTKVIFRKDYERLTANYAALSQTDPFGDFELLFGASLLHLKISDVPVRYKQRTYGATNIQRFRHGWQLLTLCLRGWSYFK